jgi:hypothetical protein
MTAFYILPAHPATRVTTFENRTRRAHIPVPRGFYPQTSISGIGTIKRLSNESRCLQATLSFMPLYQPHCNRPACPDRSFAIRPVPIIIVRFVMISKLSNQRVTQTNEILRRFVTLPYPAHNFSDIVTKPNPAKRCLCRPRVPAFRTVRIYLTPLWYGRLDSGTCDITSLR